MAQAEICAVADGGFGHYTYAKQTLKCREHNELFNLIDDSCYRMLNVAENLFKMKLSWTNDSEPHVVKYDCSTRKKSKLEMHTDNSDVTVRRPIECKP